MKYINDQTSIYQVIARAFTAHSNCAKAGNKLQSNWENMIDDIVEECFPSGSGVDNGTKFNWEKSTCNRLVFDTAFHHMDEHGYYDGWTEHQVIVTASLSFGYDIRITGRNRNDIKEYLHELFNYIYYWEEKVEKIYNENFLRTSES